MFCFAFLRGKIITLMWVGAALKSGQPKMALKVDKMTQNSSISTVWLETLITIVVVAVLVLFV